ncbi:PIG-M-domain-containing protein [Scheffersomyces amazonensis]|uniref:PIG-M-domain-containing protein n=1 Tax=Scheffersomyces amazonensis TaxID=1078765 RepID=UPI00315E0283
MIQPQLHHVFALAIALRIGFFLFGLYQDKYMIVKYTDIDYVVFTDAACYVYNGQSPYNRETYRYTPLLAYILTPNCWNDQWYSFGKFIFMISDLITGYFITKLIQISQPSISNSKLLILSSIWLLNPMVITISTRGSSESLLTVIIMASIYFLVKGNIIISALWMGLAIHLKIYPIIYLSSIAYYLSNKANPFINIKLLNLLNYKNLLYIIISLSIFASLNLIMYQYYDYQFLFETYLYHLVRLDHRHNFSIYNVLLYYKSAIPLESDLIDIERFAFIPQLLISVIAIPLVFSKSDIISTLFLQTFAFVTFNKVITSQYFIWFLIFLPHFLLKSNLTYKNSLNGIFLLLLWIVSQGSWLYFAYQLEFLGLSTFDTGLLYSSIFFFLSNCYILGQFIVSL